MAWMRTTLGVDAGTTGTRWVLFQPRARMLIPLDRPRRGRVVAALPADQAVFRTVELPRLGRRERLAALRWELQRILPVAVDDAVFDYIELGEDAGGVASALRAARSQPAETVSRQTGGVRYVVSGAPVATVDQRLEELRRQGIHPTVLEPEWVTLWRCAALLGQGRPEPAGTAVIDFGATATRLVVVDAQCRLVAFHRSPVGGQALEEDLARSLGADLAEVRSLIPTELAHDFGPLQRSQAAIGLLGDLARALRRVRAERLVKGNLELWAIGGGAAWPALRAAVAEALGEPLRVTGDASVQAAGGTIPLLGLAPRWVLAGALALWSAGAAGWLRAAVVVEAGPGESAQAPAEELDAVSIHGEERGASPA